MTTWSDGIKAVLERQDDLGTMDGDFLGELVNLRKRYKKSFTRDKVDSLIHSVKGYFTEPSGMNAISGWARGFLKRHRAKETCMKSPVYIDMVLPM